MEGSPFENLPVVYLPVVYLPVSWVEAPLPGWSLEEAAGRKMRGKGLQRGHLDGHLVPLTEVPQPQSLHLLLQHFLPCLQCLRL